VKIIVYSTNTCPICVKTKTLLNKWNLPFEQKMIDEDRTLMAEFSKVSNMGKHIGKMFGEIESLDE
jgi:glutaredoxin 3